MTGPAQKHHHTPAPLRPRPAQAFFIAKDDATKKVLWVLRGTHDVHDILTDLCGIATPIPGGAAHWVGARELGPGGALVGSFAKLAALAILGDKRVPPPLSPCLLRSLRACGRAPFG